MLKHLLPLLLATAALGIDLSSPDGEDKCEYGVNCAKNYKYSEECAGAIRDQISRELDASITYLAAGAHFSTDHASRPGIADIFWEHAKEERDHAFKLADYLNLRGDHDTGYLRTTGYQPFKDKWSSGLEALQDALRIEKEVTRHFTNMITTCEADWHAADWLTAEMLDEQHKGVREFAGHITQLRKLIADQPQLGEYMFDAQLSQSPAE